MRRVPLKPGPTRTPADGFRSIAAQPEKKVYESCTLEKARKIRFLPRAGLVLASTEGPVWGQNRKLGMSRTSFRLAPIPAIGMPLGNGADRPQRGRSFAGLTRHLGRAREDRLRHGEPSALAVFWLTIRLNLVGYSIGRSAGLGAL